ncbi:hypothetical protein ABZ819_05705 [Streptomyces venezuelae]|uniref:hypothetical protein n=1 Tax=Streptomyces venezuelae TaxID=54571 RepID=UPI0034212459
MRSWTRLASRRGVRYGAAASALLVVVGAGWFFLGGGYTSWRHEKSLADACDGTVAVDQARALLETDDVTGETRHGRAGEDSPDGASPPVLCWLEGPNGHRHRVVVEMEWRSKAWGPQYMAGRTESPYLARSGVPIGAGWSGMVIATDERATATAVLRCHNTTGPRVGDSLSVFVAAFGSRPYQEAAQRVRLAQLATQTGREAAREYGCDAQFGERVERVAPFEPGRNSYPDAPAVARAGGTCTGVRPGWLITRAHGTAADGAPVEDCLLTDDNGRTRFRLSAYYGTFADDQRLKTQSAKDFREDTTRVLRTDFVYRAQATCPGTPRQAVFVIDYRERNDDDQPQRRYARAALREFAERSAARHGCTDTELL